MDSAHELFFGVSGFTELPGRGFDEIPFIHGNDERFAHVEGHFCDSLVTIGEALFAINDEQSTFGAFESPLGAEHHIEFDASLDFAAAADTGGVDEADFMAFEFDERVDCITSCSGDVADNGALFPAEGVEH